MPGKPLDEWAQEQAPREDTMDQWFSLRPELAKQVRAGREPGPDGKPRFSFPQIGAWLIEEHGFPFKARSIAIWMRQ